MSRGRYPVDAARLRPELARGGVNAVHARLARLGRAFGAQRRPGFTMRRSAVFALVGYTLLINAIAFAAPVVTLAVFDYVVRDGASFTLACLCATGGIAIIYEMMLRRERSELAADVGVKLAASLSTGFFAHLLTRDAREMESQPTSAHVARFRALQHLRAFLTGPVVTALFDAPFALLLIAGLFA